MSDDKWTLGAYCSPEQSTFEHFLTLLEKSRALIQCIFTGDNAELSSILSQVLNDKQTVIDAQDDKGFSAICYASILGRSECLYTLLGHAANVNVVEPKHGLSPLHLAVMSGSKETAEMLLDKLADVK